MNALHTLAELTTGDVVYQVTGMCVVFCCLGFLSIILAISGAVAQRMDAKRKEQEAAAKAALAAQQQAAAPKPAPKPAAPAAPAATEPTPVQVAALAAGIFNAARSNITPEVIAAIAAAVKVTVGHEVRILDIKPVSTTYAQSGRASIMSSHVPVRR